MHNSVRWSAKCLFVAVARVEIYKKGSEEGKPSQDPKHTINQMGLRKWAICIQMKGMRKVQRFMSRRQKALFPGPVSRGTDNAQWCFTNRTKTSVSSEWSFRLDELKGRKDLEKISLVQCFDFHLVSILTLRSQPTTTLLKKAWETKIEYNKCGRTESQARE